MPLTPAPISAAPIAGSVDRAVPPAPVSRLSRADLRLRLRSQVPGSSTDRFVDGGWWPHGRDLTRELAPLLAAVEAAGYPPVHRVIYSLTAWNRPPRKLMVGGRLVRLGGFRSQDEGLLSLTDSSGWNRIDLVTVSPDAEPEVAERALTLAGQDNDQHRVGEILRLAGS
jgi:hypothetical protein